MTELVSSKISKKSQILFYIYQISVIIKKYIKKPKKKSPGWAISMFKLIITGCVRTEILEKPRATAR